MLRYFCYFLVFFICWSTFALTIESFNDVQSMNYESNVEFQKVYRRTLRAVADGFTERIGELSDDIESYSKHQGVQQFMDDVKTLEVAAEDLQDSLFDVDSSLSIIELYRIDSEIVQLKKDWEEYKRSGLDLPPTQPPIPTTTVQITTTSTAPQHSYSNLRRSIDVICADVERTKTEIKTFPPEQCSGYKLMPRLIECQTTCNAVRKYYIYDQVVSTSSFQEELKFISEKCEAIINIWQLIRNIQPDKPTIDHTCSDIGALGFDIGSFQAAKCEKDPYWKDQRILSSICARIQNDYTYVDPETLQKTFKDLEEKFNELKFKWNYFKGETQPEPYGEAHRPARPQSNNISWLGRAQRSRTTQRRSVQSQSQERDESFRKRSFSRLRIGSI